MADRRSLSIIVVPEGGTESRTFTLGYGRLRLLAAAGVLSVVLLILLVGSWGYLAVRSARYGELEARLEAERVDRERLVALSRQLEELEDRYRRIRVMFGSDTLESPSDLWLPPSGSGRGGAVAGVDPENALPTSWPLTERGFLTQPLLEGAAGDHPGLDIAVPSHSYIRAAGAGVVVQAAEDEIYGRVLVIDHGNGYRTRYAHASELLAEEGRRVRRNEVIGLTGSTGRSTAPHLHFEILREGRAVDPLTMVERPS